MRFAPNQAQAARANGQAPQTQMASAGMAGLLQHVSPSTCVSRLGGVTGQGSTGTCTSNGGGGLPTLESISGVHQRLSSRCDFLCLCHCVNFRHRVGVAHACSSGFHLESFQRGEHCAWRWHGHVWCATKAFRAVMLAVAPRFASEMPLYSALCAQGAAVNDSLRCSALPEQLISQGESSLRTSHNQ